MKNLIKNINTVSRLSILLLVISITPVNAQSYPEAGDFAKGAKTWADNCARCHNMRDPKDLRDDQWTTTVFHMRVRAGLTGQQTRDILTFLQQSNNETVVKTKVESIVDKKLSSGLSGEQIYNQTCIACHGSNGVGTVPGSPNFSKQNSPLVKSDSELMKNVIEGYQTPGSPMGMPAKGGNSSLTSEDIRSVLLFIRDKFGK